MLIQKISIVIDNLTSRNVVAHNDNKWTFNYAYNNVVLNHLIDNNDQIGKH